MTISAAIRTSNPCNLHVNNLQFPPFLCRPSRDSSISNQRPFQSLFSLPTRWPTCTTNRLDL